MPIYEYRCKKCHHQFEELVPSASAPTPRCPKCEAAGAEKLMSAIGGIQMGSGGAMACPTARTCAGAAGGGCQSCPMAEG